MYFKNNQPANNMFKLTFKVIVGILVCGSLSLNNSAFAQIDPKRAAAISVIVSTLLLEEQPTEIELGVNGFDPVVKTVNKDFSVSLDSRSRDIEFCFFLTARQSVSQSNLTLQINGITQTGSNSPRTGENCYTIPVAQQSAQNVVVFRVNNGQVITLRDIGVTLASPTMLRLPSLTRSSWNERAVRKVLKIFAFGGHATDSQIRAWANMRPNVAIREMLNFNQHNPKLSPLAAGEKYRETATSHGTFSGFLDHISSPSSDIPVDAEQRQYLGIDGYRFDSTFGRMVVMRGLNPFRQKIGFWETNYHLATNLNASVERQQMAVYYDAIMQAHEQRLPYHQVIGVAAKSAAVATQYGHRRNRWVCRGRNDNEDCRLEGNEDFAREIHQLFYGIFGVDNPDSHENITIPNTAKMLTDMRVPYIDGFGRDTKVTFGTDDHHRDEFGSLRILGRNIFGIDAAAKIDNLMPISIQHPESLDNLPVYIINTLADDSLTDSKRAFIRRAWRQLGTNKDFLTFIHAYAISDMFHAPDHVKYLTSFDRSFYLANRFNIDNIEAYLSNDYNEGRAGRNIDDVMEGDNASEAFRPLHNVFGGQTSQEASDAAVGFEKNYNRSAASESWRFNRNLPISCEGCDQGQEWNKDWTKVIPRPRNGYTADYVARWLWRHAIGNYDNYTDLERAQLVAILGSRRLQDEEGTELPWELDDQYPFFDLNSLLCIREDRLEDGQTNNSLADLMAYDSWRSYCRENGGEYTQTEINAFNFSFNGQQLANNNADPFPYLRGLIEELAQAEVNLNDSDAIQRRRANERVQAALAFIFATPFIFAEGE